VLLQILFRSLQILSPGEMPSRSEVSSRSSTAPGGGLEGRVELLHEGDVFERTSFGVFPPRRASGRAILTSFGVPRSLASNPRGRSFLPRARHSRSSSTEAWRTSAASNVAYRPHSSGSESPTYSPDTSPGEEGAGTSAGERIASHVVSIRLLKVTCIALAGRSLGGWTKGSSSARAT
jgi:hypothetical protein